MSQWIPNLVDLDMVQESLQESNWRRAVRAMLTGVPDQFLERSERLLELSNVFHEEIALQSEQALNEFLKLQPVESVRQSLLDDIETKLAQVHLAIKCPKSNRPTKLTMEESAEHGRPKRFRLVMTNDRGETVRNVCRGTLPSLEVMVDNGDRETAFTQRIQKTSVNKLER